MDSKAGKFTNNRVLAVVGVVFVYMPVQTVLHP
jgi:hypothetical protein